jgi:hypothetical protein
LRRREVDDFVYCGANEVGARVQYLGQFPRNEYSGVMVVFGDHVRKTGDYLPDRGIDGVGGK